MATLTVKSTYSLDPDTAEQIESLARQWDTSKSEVIRRAVRMAAQPALDTLPVAKASSVTPEAAARIEAVLGLSASLAAESTDFDAWRRAITQARR